MNKMWMIGVDIGGTNTDAALIAPNGELAASIKVPTTDDIKTGFERALEALIANNALKPADVKAIAMGTTHATNAILQHQGLYKVGVIRIAGQRPESIPACYGWPGALKAAIFAGEVSVSGGFECHGGVITPFSKREFIAELQHLLKMGAESLAIVGVFSPLKSDHELEALEIGKQILGKGFPISISSAIGGIGFIERENSTILNAALKKVMAQGFRELEHVKQNLGFKCPLLVSQNNGSLITLDEAIENPILTISAGPTNSFRGASLLAGVTDALIVDIGGTSTDIGVIQEGFPRRSLNTSNIGGINLNFPMPDVLSIALGGGSYVSMEHGHICFGPQSAGKRVIEESLSFGGKMLTFMDIALAGGILKIEGAIPNNVPLASQQIQQAIENAIEKIRREIQWMQAEKKHLPILMVGGGAALFPKGLMGDRFVWPKNAAVANAYGAGLGEISGTIDKAVSLQNRDKVLGELQQEAAELAIKRGAVASTVRIVEMNILPYNYVRNNMARVTVTASGKFQWIKL